MTPKLVLLPLAFLTLAGCAGFAPDCTQDWYDAGQREGRYGPQAWDVQYAAACGTRFDRARYVSGWQAGFSARPSPVGM